MENSSKYFSEILVFRIYFSEILVSGFVLNFDFPVAYSDRFLENSSIFGNWAHLMDHTPEMFCQLFALEIFCQ